MSEGRGWGTEGGTGWGEGHWRPAVMLGRATRGGPRGE